MDKLTEEVFTTLVLSDGTKVTVNKLKGRHMVEAMIGAGGDTGKMVFNYLYAVCYINGKQIDAETIADMDAVDVNAMIDAVSCQLNKLF